MNNSKSYKNRLLLEKWPIKKEDLFFEMIQDLEVKIDNDRYPNSTFLFRDNKVWFEIRHEYFHCNYHLVWKVFEEEYGLNYNEIKSFIKSNVEKYFKYDELMPLQNYIGQHIKVEEHFRLKELKLKEDMRNEFKQYKEYEIISNYYGDKMAKRSGVHLMNHIDEGLCILEKIGASEIAKRAYCLHPIFQSDESLIEGYSSLDLSGIESSVIIAVMEYRSVANEYLSYRKVESLDEIRLSPLKDVNDMLIADKIQNRKDFEIYHKGIHLRSSELDLYFDNWMKKLGISSEFYDEVCKSLKNLSIV